MSDQLVAENLYLTIYNTQTTDRHPCLTVGFKSTISEKPSGRSPTHLRPRGQLGPATQSYIQTKKLRRHEGFFLLISTSDYFYGLSRSVANFCSYVSEENTASFFTVKYRNPPSLHDVKSPRKDHHVYQRIFLCNSSFIHSFIHSYELSKKSRIRENLLEKKNQCLNFLYLFNKFLELINTEHPKL
jgi:hypothetical protein